MATKMHPETLDFEETRLTSVPAGIMQLKMVKFFSLNGNRISSLPASIGGMEELQNLGLGDNKLGSIPAEITPVQLGDMSIIGKKDAHFTVMIGQVF